ncbi:unnamed protein product [Rhizophagus irregularis]|nr:unnamed protein product [Rhizophagus irregularis]CAB4439103.1 unnamed protein product [Rhizophagus irregularis]
MSQLCASTNFSLREKELQQNKVQFLDLNVETEVEDSEVEYSEIPEDTENAEDNTNIINSEHCDGDLLSEYTHPIIDKRARWELRIRI